MTRQLLIYKPVPCSAGSVDKCNANLIIIEPADALAPTGARASAGTVMTTYNHPDFFNHQWFVNHFLLIQGHLSLKDFLRALRAVWGLITGSVSAAAVWGVIMQWSVSAVAAYNSDVHILMFVPEAIKILYSSYLPHL